MGTGKSVVGKIIAERLCLKFVDTDDLIESKTGKTISEIFDGEGENKFREIESEVISEVCSGIGQVISTGGGAITIERNLDVMKKAGPVVALKASVDEIFSRVKGEEHRPLLNTEGPQDRIRELLEKREPHYAKADITVDTTGKSPEIVAGEILEKLKKCSLSPGGRGLG